MPAPDPRPRDTKSRTDDAKGREMAQTSAPRATDEDTPSPKRRLTSRVPIWVRVSVITGVVLLGVLLSTILLAAAGIDDRGDSGGRHGSRGEMEMNRDGSGGDHGSGDNDSGSDHGSGGDRGSDRDHGDETD